MGNPLVSVISSIVDPLYDLLTKTEDFRAIAAAIGLPGARMHMATALYAMHRAFRARHGAIIETTVALNSMLRHADIAADLPSRFFVPPFPACYVHFNEGLQIQPEEETSGCQTRIVGVYVLAHDGLAHLGEQSNPLNGEILDFETARRWGINEGSAFKKLDLLVVIDELEADGGGNRRVFCTELVVASDSDVPLLDVIRSRRRADVAEIKVRWPSHVLMSAIEHLSKVFLYMGLSEARRIEVNEARDASKKVAGLGPKSVPKRRGNFAISTIASSLARQSGSIINILA